MKNLLCALATDKPDSTRLWRYFHNLYGVFSLSEKFGLTLCFDVGQEQVEKGGSTGTPNGFKTWGVRPILITCP